MWAAKGILCFRIQFNKHTFHSSTHIHSLMTRSRSFCDSNQLKKIEIAHFSQKKFQKSLKCGCKYYLSKWQHLFTTANASFGCMHAHNYAILNHLFIFIIIYLEWKLKRKYNLKIMLNEHWAVRVYTKCDELASKRWILGGICRQNTDNQASFEKKKPNKQAEDASDITSADLFRLSSKSNEKQPKIWITSRRIQRISIIIATTKNTKQHKTCYGKMCVHWNYRSSIQNTSMQCPC